MTHIALTGTVGGKNVEELGHLDSGIEALSVRGSLKVTIEPLGK